MGGYAFILAVISLFIFHRYHILKQYLWIYRRVTVLYFLMLIYAMARVMFEGGDDIRFILAIIKSIIILLTTFIFLASFNGKVDLKKILFNLFLINACIALIIGANPEYLNIVNYFKPDGLSTILIGSIPFRNAFLAGSGYFGIAAPYAIVISFFLGLLTISQYNMKGWRYYPLLLIMFIAGVLAGRIVIFCVLFMLLYLIFLRGRIKLLGLFAIMLPILFYLINTPIFLPAKLWIINAISILGNHNSSSSFNHLVNDMIIFPNNPITLIFGDGIYNLPTGGYYMGTDIGYLRHLFFGGIIFSTFVLLLPFALYDINRDKMFLFALIPIVLLLHFKGVILLNSPMAMPVLIIITEILRSYRIKGKI